MPSRWVIWTLIGWMPFILIYYSFRNESNSVYLFVFMIFGLALVRFLTWRMFNKKP